MSNQNINPFEGIAEGYLTNLEDWFCASVDKGYATDFEKAIGEANLDLTEEIIHVFDCLADIVADLATK